MVDGVRAPGPVNANTVAAGDRFPQSILYIRGDAEGLREPQALPKGSVHVEFFESKLQQRERSYYVYAPPKYRSTGRGRFLGRFLGRFPLLVLLPGTPGTEAGWVTIGLANRVFDNLIAGRRMQPMLILMLRADVLVKGGTRAGNLEAFDPLLLGEVMPHFESRYRVKPRANARAIAGYSLGGELALTVGSRHPELFGTVGSFGGSVFEKEFEDRFGRAWSDPNRYGLIWVGCGSEDLFLPGNRKLSEILKQKDIQHTFREVPGNHSTPTFRRLLIDLVRALFR